MPTVSVLLPLHASLPLLWSGHDGASSLLHSWPESPLQLPLLNEHLNAESGTAVCAFWYYFSLRRNENTNPPPLFKQWDISSCNMQQ